jgi:hypothetical protein
MINKVSAVTIVMDLVIIEHMGLYLREKNGSNVIAGSRYEMIIG